MIFYSNETETLFGNSASVEEEIRVRPTSHSNENVCYRANFFATACRLKKLTPVTKFVPNIENCKSADKKVFGSKLGPHPDLFSVNI